MQDKPRQWCRCGHSYTLHNVIRASAKPNGALTNKSRWWWICHHCFSFEAYQEQ